MPSTKPEKVTTITVSTLRQRGWSDRLILAILGEPDMECTNPHYKCASPMRLYAQARVEEGEQDPRWVAYQASRAKRSERAKATADRKKQQLMDWVQALVIEIPKVSDDELLSRAIASYNYRSDSTMRAASNSDNQFLDRICVNYLRHCCSDYESLLDQTFGNVGTLEAKLAIKGRVLDAISDKYPHLALECIRQMDRASKIYYGMSCPR